MFILKAENAEKAGHIVKPHPPRKMCTLTSVVRSQHAIGTRSNKNYKEKIPYTSISDYNNAFGASWCVHSAHGVCALQNTLIHLLFVCLFVCDQKRAL